MITEIDSTDIKSFDYKETTISDGAITGVCELGEFSFEMFNDENKYSTLKDKWVHSMFGDIYIYDIEPDQASMTIKIRGYDSRYKLDKEYDEKLYSFPMTLREWRNAVLIDSDLQYKEDDAFPHSELVLNEQPYIGKNLKNRDAIKLMTQATLSILLKDYSDIYSFGWFEDVNIIEVEDCIDLTTDSEYTEPINLLVLGRGEVGDDIYWPQELPNNKHEFRIDNNYILDDQGEVDKRLGVIEPLFNRISDFCYVPYLLRTTFIENKLNLKLGNKIRFYDRNNKPLESYIMSKTITFLGGDYNNSGNYEVSLSAELIDETNTEISYASNVKNELLQVERKANKNEGSITDLVKEIFEEDGIVNEKFTQLLMELNNIIMSVQQSGGNNLIKNSVGFAGTTEWELAYDDEDTSTVNTISSVELLQNGVSGGAFLLNGVKISQNIIVNSKDTYTFNCKVQKRAGFSGYIKVYNANDLSQIWEKQFTNEEELNFENITFENIKINGNSLIVEFYGVEGSNLTITDSMLNLGDLSSIWTQANGEILNTQVNINKDGVMVKSVQFDENGQYTIISPLEFAGYANKNGQSIRVFTINGDTTEVENIYIKNNFKLPPIKLVPIRTGSNRGVALVPDWSGM